MRRGLLLILLALCALPPTLTAQERRLHWDDVVVEARLDADGVLHVRETQTFVFTGDWNGGERGFRVDWGEDLDFRRLVRVEPGGREVELSRGDLEEVDHYDWSDDLLRWRSRLPGDPPFREARKTYRIEYEMRGVLRPTASGTYQLTHDFLFPERPGPIRRFALDISLAPGWQVLGPLPAHVEQRDLPPGEGFVLPLEVAWRGEGTPASVPHPLATDRTAALWALVLLGAVPFLLFRLVRRERRLGRFTRLPVAETWDVRLLRKELLSFRPEEIGALWDRRVGPPEVAAVLARLTAEGKLESRVLPKEGLFGRPTLWLGLKQPLESFEGYERALLEKLFFGGRTEVDTSEIRRHYKNRGLDPSGLIRAELERRLAARTDLGRSPAPGRLGPLLLAAAALALFARDLFLYRLVAFPVALVTGVAAALLYTAAAWAARRWRDRVERLVPATAWFLAPSFFFLLVVLAVAFQPPGSPSYPGLGASLALPLLAVAFLWSVTHWAMSREDARAVAQRKRLAGLRRMLRGELQRREPRLEDAWFPYLLALGLEKDVDRWFGAFGGASSGGATSGAHLGSTAASSGGGSGWTGGGGSFGGAGATAGWSVAAAGLAGGVASASSSGGGGGGGGGSSGGGSGGGW